MIPRYSTKKMTELWSTKNKYHLWLKIEVLACEIQEKIGVIPKNKSARIKKLANFDENRILDIEKETKHDVIAFLTNLSENIGDDSRFIHQGVTSSDILDKYNLSSSSEKFFMVNIALSV